MKTWIVKILACAFRSPTITGRNANRKPHIEPDKIHVCNAVMFDMYVCVYLLGCVPSLKLLYIPNVKISHMYAYL